MLFVELMLAHKAEEEGSMVEVIAGQKPHINYNLIPGCFILGQKWLQ
jgi:pyruvate/2-oxoglutarate dehydrogenase complex dihydrolipoamide dehydrogenase (E3) component